MKKLILITAFLLSISGVLQAQIYVDKNGNVYDQRKTTTKTTSPVLKNNKPSGSSFDKSKLSFGGNLSLQFGDYTVVGISPQVGYDFNKYFTAGAGIGYTYFKDKRYDYKWSSNYFSFNLFSRFYPVEYIVIGIQPEISYSQEKIYNNNNTYKYIVPSFLVGGGLRLGGMIAMVQYDVVQDDNSPYGNSLFYSVGYTFRF